MILTPLLFFAVSLTVAPLRISLHSSLSLFTASERCLSTWALITSQFCLPFLFLHSFALMSVLLTSIVRKVVEITLLNTSIHSLFLQRNTRFFLFPLPLRSLTLWHEMRPSLPLLLAASNVNLKPDGFPKRKNWQEKDARFLLPFTEVKKSVRLTSQTLVMPSWSSPSQGKGIAQHMHIFLS